VGVLLLLLLLQGEGNASPCRSSQTVNGVFIGLWSDVQPLIRSMTGKHSPAAAATASTYCILATLAMFTRICLHQDNLSRN
jgi:hypothetical protein